MVTYEEALKSVLERVNTLAIEEKPVMDCLGQVTAEDIYSDYDLPPMDSSRSDGYAVRSADIVGASKSTPVMLDIIENVRAGFLPKKTVIPGTATRIMTGSILPAGADCIVRFEDTDEPGEKNGPNNNNPTKVAIYVSSRVEGIRPGGEVNKAGNDIKRGALVLSKGSVIGPVQLSVLTILGKSQIKVHRRPLIAIIANGDELIELGQPLSAGKAFNCNTGALKALISHYGCIPLVLGIARDTEESLVSTISKGLKADAIITSGGVSKGDFDLVRLVLGKSGKIFFVRIGVVPGASCSFGEYYDPTKGMTAPIPVFALAGPPSGCIINFELLVRPALLKMLGPKETDHPFIEAITEDAFPEKRMMFVKWANVGLVGNQFRVKIDTSSDKGQLFSMINANSLAILPAGKAVPVGDRIHVWPLPLSMLGLGQDGEKQ